MPTDPTRAALAHFAELGVDEDLVRVALVEATRHGADHADLFFEHSLSTSIGLQDRSVNRCHTSVDLGVGVRVVKGDQVGYAYTEALTVPAIRQAARTASEIARGGSAVTPVEVRASTVPSYYPVDRPWSEVEIGRRIPLVRDWNERAHAADPRVDKVQVSLSDSDDWILVATADGRLVGDYRPSTRAYLACVIADGDKRESGSYNVAGRAGLDYYTPDRQERLVAEAVRRAARAVHAGKPPAGEMTVVLGRGDAGVLLHEAIGHGMEADFNRKGTSIYAGRIGQRIAPKGVTVVDDATLAGARGALDVDDEANPTERTVLVRDGILESYLHDGISARHYGVAPTGSGRRESFRHPVFPRMRCTYLEAGEHDPAEIIGSVERGIYCEEFGNGQVAIGAGDFSFYVRFGYLIENGRLTAPIKDVNLVGNGPKVLETIEMVGNDLVIDEGGWTCGKEGQHVPVSQGMPTVKVRNLSIGGGR